MLDYILIKTGINAMLARRDEEGASAVEYGLLVAGIAALIVAIVFLFGGMIKQRLHRHLHRRHQRSDATAPPRLHLIQCPVPGGADRSSTGSSVSSAAPARLTREAPHVGVGRASRACTTRTAPRPSSTACWSPASPP